MILGSRLRDLFDSCLLGWILWREGFELRNSELKTAEAGCG